MYVYISDVDAPELCFPPPSQQTPLPHKGEPIFVGCSHRNYFQDLEEPGFFLK